MWVVWAWNPLILELLRPYRLLDLLIPGVVLGICAMVEGALLWIIFGLCLAQRRAELIESLMRRSQSELEKEPEDPRLEDVAGEKDSDDGR
ncbi:hypothetical protein PIIN_06285 [Serendipita indica DSM 11827]|uniref:Uncharacterized protein n=1 Tax=Serendipita indica (strain DSM 11827) TaxID=1109443 RepID=G4TM07_SERID|nr:hypothetical protein PIIN_06285 [Serendipita indica DSM 11827]